MTSVWKIVDRHRTDVAEQSAVAFISGKHGFLVVDDETSLLWAVSAPRADAPLVKTALRKDDGRLKGLEGVVIDGDLFIIGEGRSPCCICIASDHAFSPANRA